MSSLMPNLSPSWETAHPNHSSFQLHGTPSTPGPKAYFIQLEARPGHEDAVAAFLRDINTGVNLEPGTGPWFGTRYSKTTFAIFEAFPDHKRRTDHDSGPGGLNFARFDELREMPAWPAQIYRLDVMHGKFGTMFGEKTEFEGREGYENQQGMKSRL